MEIKTIKSATAKSDGRGYQKITYTFTDGTSAVGSDAYETLAKAKEICKNELPGKKAIVGGYTASFLHNYFSVFKNRVTLIGSHKCEKIYESGREALDAAKAEALAKVEEMYQTALVEGL